MTAAPRSLFALVLAASGAYVAACTDDDEPAAPIPGVDASLAQTDATVPDASSPEASVEAASPDAAAPDAASDAGADGAVIVGCIPQEVSTRYDATWMFGNSCVAKWNASNQVTFDAGGIDFAGIEGTIVAANPFTGALVAASDGIDIYDGLGVKRNDGGSLGANVSSAQPVAFIGKPGSPTGFYVITNSASDSQGGSGLFASSLECASVTPVSGPTPIPGTTGYTEALATVRHANNVDRWILSGTTNGIAVIPITAAGIGTPSVTDYAGTLTGVAANERAFIAFARDRKTFALTVDRRGLVVGKFDNATGVVSALVSVPVPSTTNLYSSAFSPDGTKLYVSQWSGSFWQTDLSLVGVDAGLGDAGDAGDSGAPSPISASLGVSTGALRLAIDDKIYLAAHNASTLRVIENPNAAAAALVITTINLPAGCTSTYGLPGVGDL